MKSNRLKITSVIILSVTLSIMMQSCSITRKYVSPQIETENLFRYDSPTDTITIADLHWQEFFTDPFLRELIAEGLGQNFDLQIAVTRIKQAEASLSIARGAFFPSVDLVGNVSHYRSSNGNSVLGYHGEQYTLGISTSWELDIWGKLNSQSKAKYAQFMGTHAYRNLIQTSLIANIATSYYSLLALDEQLNIVIETAELLKETTSTMEDMMQAGLLNGASVQQSKALLYNTQVNIPDLQIQIRQLENSISTMLGRKPGAIERSLIKDQYVANRLDYGVPIQMLARRPDVQQAELSFRSAFELTKAAQASFYPSITLTSGTLGYGATTLSQFFHPENIFANVIGGLTQPVFANRQLTGNLKIAKAQQEEALLTFEKTVLTAGQEVSDILYSYEFSLKKNDIRIKQIIALNTAVEFSKELLKAGEANYIEVLLAEQDLLQAQLGQISDKLEQLQYSVSLYKALGGGIK